MAEAVVDLPDPISLPPAAENADELLSQLAGEQIDRLLSESENSEPATALPHDEASFDPPVAIPLPIAPATGPATPATVEATIDVVESSEHESYASESDASHWLVRILELLNAPFAAVSPEIRDVLGKLGILLLINALGFILFAVLTKRH